MKRHFLKLIAVSVLLSAPLAAELTRTAKPLVFGRYEGLISQVSQRYLNRLLTEAENSKAQAVVLMLDTPGGMITPMEKMIQSVLASKIPVVVYVSPQGAKAASAGTFLVTAADVAIMAPNTSIGAAHPVDSKGNKLSEKVANALAAEMETLALNKGRNADWARMAVLESASVGEKEALEKGVIEGIVRSESELIIFLQDRQVTKNGNTIQLKTKYAKRIDVDLNWAERLLALLSDPNIAYILFLVGLYGIIFEIKTPGFGVGGIIGVLSLALAFMSFGSLPINFGGLGLLCFGILLMIAEAIVVSGGILGVGGAVVMLFGSFLLFGADTELYRVSTGLIVVMVGMSVAVFLYLLKDAVKVLKRRALQDTDSLIGQNGNCVKEVNPIGIVHVDGEDWTARCAEGSVKKGQTVKVIGLYGLSLVVEGLLPAANETRESGIGKKQKIASAPTAEKKRVEREIDKKEKP